MTKHLKGVEQGGESCGGVQMQSLLFYRAFRQRHALAALQTGEVMHITFKRRIKSFTRGKMTAAHLSFSSYSWK